MNNIKEVNLPELKELHRINHLLKDRSPGIHELFAREVDILADLKDFDHDEITNYKIRNLPSLVRGFKRISHDYGLDQGAFTGLWLPRGTLNVQVVRKDQGEVLDLGLVSVNLVTDAFVNYLTDSLQDSTTNPLDAFVWHASGTGTTAEAAGDTALETEQGSRVEDTTPTEGGSANIYHTEAQLSYGSSLNITEHGVLTAPTGGTLLDRSVFTTIPGDTNTDILFKYELTSNSGG